VCLLDVSTINTNEGPHPHGHPNILSWESSTLLTPLSPTLLIAHSSVDIFNPTYTDAICAALTWLELGSYPKAIHDDPTLSNIPFYNIDNYDNDDEPVLEPTVTFIADIHPTTIDPVVDPASKYLYALSLHLQDTKSDVQVSIALLLTLMIAISLLTWMLAQWPTPRTDLTIYGNFNYSMIQILHYRLQTILLITPLE